MIHWLISAILTITIFPQQEDVALKSIVTAKKAGIVKHYATKTTRRELTYLGSVKVNGKVAYHVVSEFRQLKMAITWRGYSHVICCTADGRAIRSYDFGMPEELPFALRSNTLHQKYRDENRLVVDSIMLTKAIPDQLVSAGAGRLYEAD